MQQARFAYWTNLWKLVWSCWMNWQHHQMFHLGLWWMFLVINSFENCVQAWRLKIAFVCPISSKRWCKNWCRGCGLNLQPKPIQRKLIKYYCSIAEECELSHWHLRIALLVYACMYISRALNVALRFSTALASLSGGKEQPAVIVMLR